MNNQLEKANVEVYESNEKTPDGFEFIDKYTVVLFNDEIYGMSEGAYCFNQFCGNLSQRDVNTGKKVYFKKNFGKKLKEVPEHLVKPILERIKN